MRSLSLVPFVLAVLSTACATGPGALEPHAPTPAPAPSAHPTTGGGTGRPSGTRPTGSAAFAASSNAFGVDLYRALASKRGNLVMSPASIQTALEMTWAGAKGETADQMRRVLHLDADPHAALDAAKASVASYAKTGGDYELSFANKLFGDRSYPFDPAFVALSKDTFGAPLEALDFAHKPEAGRHTINAFVDASTKSRIKDLLPEGAIDGDTRLVLVNAVYMKAKWATPFMKESTFDAPFATPDGTKNVPTMHAQGQYAYGETDGALVLDMPYKGGDLAFTVILPKDAKGLAALEKSLGEGSLERFVGATHPALVDLALPKLKIDPSEPVRLKPVLSTLGMPLAFTDSADFSRMMTKEGQPLKVSDAFHKAFVLVDEAGTEAAAATAVVMTKEMATSVPPKAIPFRADHPFLFAVRDVRSGLVLFLGRASDPSA